MVLLLYAVVCAILTCGCQATSGEFSILSYNVAGLLEPFSSAVLPRAGAHTMISTLINDFNIVNVQEDFNYHNELINGGNNHKFVTRTTGGMGWGSGLNTFSNFPLQVLRRQRWGSCRVSDCLTPKGFDFMEVLLEDNIKVHIYNLHAQAGQFSGARDVRKENFLLLSRFIDRHSKDHPVVVYGDFNCRYAQDREALDKLLLRGFTDVWHEVVRSPTILSLPEVGSDSLDCPIDDDSILNYTSPFCEDIDKVMYRSSAFVRIAPKSYAVLVRELSNAEGENLSDHPGITAQFEFFTNQAFRHTREVGGHKGGRAFSDVEFIQNSLVQDIISVELFGKSRLVGIRLVYDNEVAKSYGTISGTSKKLLLTEGERITSGFACVGGKSSRTTRVYMLRLATSVGRKLSVGSQTAECSFIPIEAGYKLLGFHGKKGKEIDRIGFVLREI